MTHKDTRWTAGRRRFSTNKVFILIHLFAEQIELMLLRSLIGEHFYWHCSIDQCSYALSQSCLLPPILCGMADASELTLWLYFQSLTKFFYFDRQDKMMIITGTSSSSSNNCDEREKVNEHVIKSCKNSTLKQNFSGVSAGQSVVVVVVGARHTFFPCVFTWLGGGCCWKKSNARGHQIMLRRKNEMMRRSLTWDGNN